MKKVGIVTVFYTENCGSVLQAKCLADKLQEYDRDVYFISTINSCSGHSFKRLIKNCIKKIIKRESFILAIKKYINYSNFIKNNFKIINKNKLSNLSAIYFGSDTVWDVDSEYFLLSQDIFWGISFPDIPMYSYATSIANSSYEHLDNLNYPVAQLEKFELLGVRDKYTKKYVDSRTKQDSNLVCDPTLLFDSDYYYKYIKNKIEEDYLLLYLFDEPNEETKKQIVEFCKKRKMKIVCMIGIGKLISFADEYIESTIENFLTYFYYAKYIVTNTFHGTIFSVIFNKKFVTLNYKKVKIEELLNQLCISDRLIDKDIENNLNKEIDYEKVNSNIKKLRQDSEEFIERTI